MAIPVLVLLLATISRITAADPDRPEKIVAKAHGTTLILPCPSGSAGAWYHAPSNYDTAARKDATPARLLHRRRRELVVVVRGDNELGFYKCVTTTTTTGGEPPSHPKWNYEVVSNRRRVVRKKRDENSKRCTDNGVSPGRIYYHYEIIRIDAESSAILRCRYNGYDPAVALAAKVAADSSGYTWYWVPRNDDKENNLTWTKRNYTAGMNRSVEFGYVECRYGTSISTFIDRFYVVVQGSEPKSETSLVRCFMSKQLTPSWFFRTASNTYEQSETNKCKNSARNATACYRGSGRRKRLKLRLKYDGKDELTTSAFRCGVRVGTTLDEKCWIIMITIEHRQGLTTSTPTTISSDFSTISSTHSSLSPTSLTPNSSDPTTTGSKDSANAIIGGLTATGVALVLLVSIAVVVLTCKKRRQNPIWLSTRDYDDKEMSKNVTYNRQLPDIVLPKSMRVIEGIRLNKTCLIPKQNVTLLNRLGEGCFGVVMKGTLENINGIKEPTSVAVKVPKAENRKTVQELVAEVNVWTRIGKHANVISLVGVSVFEGTTGRLLWVVMEHAKHGCLSEYLRAKRCFGRVNQSSNDVNDDTLLYVPPDEQTVLTSRDMFRYALDVARGMEHLAERQCLHRDLAARNVLVCAGDVLKIADFGMAKDIHYFDYYRKRSPKSLVPMKWTAPESLLYRVFTESSDVWSFGVLLWEIATLGSAPYPGVPVETLYDLLTRDSYRMRKPRTCSRTFYDLMLKCWALEPKDRPKFHELVELIEYEEKNYSDDGEEQSIGFDFFDDSREERRANSRDDSGLPASPTTPSF